jgi:hypothetical protein
MSIKQNRTEASRRIAEFDEENGNDSVRVADMLLFSNGARRGTDQLCALIDPPHDDHERCRLVARYWETRLERAREAFDEKRSHYISQAKGALEGSTTPEPVADPEEAARELETLRVAVRHCQKQLRQARASLEATPSKKPQANFAREREARSAHNRKANEELLSAVTKIRI